VTAEGSAPLSTAGASFDAIIEVGGTQQIVQKGRFYSCNSLNVSASSPASPPLRPLRPPTASTNCFVLRKPTCFLHGSVAGLSFGGGCFAAGGGD
jgi:hypothetical protein